MILASTVIGAILYFAHAVFIPVALSLLFALVLSSPVEALHRHRVPRGVGAMLILMGFLSVAGETLNLVWEPAQHWLASAPHTVSVIEQKISPLAGIIHRIETVTERTGILAGDTANPAASAPRDYSGLLTQTGSALVRMVTMVILTLFLLAGGPPMLARMAASLGGDTQSNVVGLIDAVRREVGRYYATITLINLGLGLATGFAMLMLNMPSPFLWGTLAAVLNFIPYVGSATTLVLLSIVAFVSFDGLGHVIAVPASYLALSTMEGQVIQPLFVGRRLELNPIIVFLAVWFGGWFWGIAGIVMAVPSIVVLKVIAEHHDRGHTLAEFLSPGAIKGFGPIGARVNPVARPENSDNTR